MLPSAQIMRTNALISILATIVAVMVTSSPTASARNVRTYGGGKGYHYRVPSVDAAFNRWHEAPLIPARGRHSRHGVAPLASVGSSMDSILQFEFSGKIVIVPRKNAIETVQRSLTGLGYYQGPATGTMNRNFEQALRKYQAASGARNSGVVDAETIDSLGLNPASFTR